MAGPPIPNYDQYKAWYDPSGSKPDSEIVSAYKSVYKVDPPGAPATPPPAPAGPTAVSGMTNVPTGGSPWVAPNVSWETKKVGDASIPLPTYHEPPGGYSGFKTDPMPAALGGKAVSAADTPTPPPSAPVHAAAAPPVGAPPGLKDSISVKLAPAEPTGGGMGGAPAAPPGPPPPDPWWKSYLEKFPDRVREHMKTMGDGAANEHNMYANSLLNQAAKADADLAGLKEMERVRAEQKKLEQDHIKKGMDAYEAKWKALADKGISADNIWASRDTGASVLSILGMFLGAFSAPYTNGKNVAVEQFERMIDRDLAVQKYNLENEKEGLKNQGGILQDWMNIYRDKDMAHNAAKASYLQMAARELENMGARAKGEIAKAQVPLMIAETQFKADKYTAMLANDLKTKAELEARRLMLQRMAGAGGGSGGGAATGIIADIEKAGGIHAYKKFVDSHGYPPIVKSEKVFAQDGPNKGQYLGTHILVIDPKTNTVVDKVAANGKNAVNVAAFGPSGAAIVNKDGILQVNPAMASSPDAVKKINDANTAFSSAKSAVKTIVNLRKQVGWLGKWKDTDGVKAQLKDAYGRYIAALTVLRNTGVMSQGEYDRYRKEVPDPTSGDWNPANFGSGDGILASWEALDPQLDFSYKNNVNFLLSAPNGPMTEGYEENKGKLDGTDADKDDE